MLIRVGCVAVAAALVLSLPAPAEESHPPHWGYSADDGPARWAELSPEWEICAGGRRQSPIDLHRTSAAEKEPLRFSYRPADFQIVRHEHVLDFLDNGHTIQVNWDDGSSVRVGEHEYGLLQFHFHAPSEHTVDGRRFPMELHLVHRDEDGNLAVVGVLVEEGARNSAYDVIWSNLPESSGEKRHLEGVHLEVDDLVPQAGGTWRYEGSMTTPPCTEGVRWLVVMDPVSLSKEQIAAYTSHYSGNNRPVQSSNNRILLEVSGPEESTSP